MGRSGTNLECSDKRLDVIEISRNKLYTTSFESFGFGAVNISSDASDLVISIFKE